MIPKTEKDKDLDESNKNEEDLLAFSSKYKTNIYKEEENKENNFEPRNVRNRLSFDSTTNSQEHSHISISGSNFLKLNSLPNDKEISHRSTDFNGNTKSLNEFQEKQRKMSSPLCCYYDGSDVYLSKTQKTTIDMNNSPNFIKKDSFFNMSDKMINKNFIINNSINENDNININFLSLNNKPKFSSLENNIEENEQNKKKQKNNKIKRLSLNINQMPNNDINNINRLQKNNIINNNYFFQNNNFQPQIFNINYINLNNFQNNINPMNNTFSKRKLSYNIEDGFIGNYFNNILNLNNNSNQNQNIFNLHPPQQKLNPILFSYNEEQEKFTSFDNNRKISNKSMHNNNKNEKKPFDKREGDWLCPKCHNLNFAFRLVCNRCQLPKPNNSSTNGA